MDNLNKNVSPNCLENDLLAKRKKIMAAVSEEIVDSDDDDDNVEDGIYVYKVMTDENTHFACSSALHALGETIRNTLLEINTIREKNRERRHKELLQLLTEMVQHENMNSKSSSFNEQVVPMTDVGDKDTTDNGKTVKRVYDQNDIDSATKSKEFLTKMKKVHEHQVNKSPHVCKAKNNTANIANKELKQLRAQMLEIQRKKMEDRERKKARNYLNIKYVNKREKE